MILILEILYSTKKGVSIKNDKEIKQHVSENNIPDA